MVLLFVLGVCPFCLFLGGLVYNFYRPKNIVINFIIFVCFETKKKLYICVMFRLRGNWKESFKCRHTFGLGDIIVRPPTLRHICVSRHVRGVPHYFSMEVKHLTKIEIHSFSKRSLFGNPTKHTRILNNETSFKTSFHFTLFIREKWLLRGLEKSTSFKVRTPPYSDRGSDAVFVWPELRIIVPLCSFLSWPN